MQTWLVEAATPHRLIDAAAVASLVDAIGSADPQALAGCVLEAVRPLLGASHCTVFAHEAGRNPRLVSGATDDGPWIAFRTGAVHAREFATQDPLREVIERRPAAGPVGSILVCRLRTDELPEGALRDDCMDAAGLVDRLSVLVRSHESTWLVAHLYRDAAGGLFSSQDVESLAGTARLIARCVARHYACDVDGVAAVRDGVSEGVHGLGSRLTGREREVLTRILDGVTVNRIAEDLKLRPTTVATYRMRAYEKLGVTSRQELFAAMLRYRAATPPVAAPASTPLTASVPLWHNTARHGGAMLRTA